MKCNNCKHANWKRNVRGVNHFIENGALVIRGHHIERDYELVTPCPVFERLK